MIYKQIQTSCQTLIAEFDRISSERKQTLEKITAYIASGIKAHKPIQLIYICTHNSRRSHFGQIWSMVAAAYYNIRDVKSFSGGTEATSLNVNAIHALKRVGFDIAIMKEKENPVYQIRFGEDESSIECFSKIYDHPVNPQSGFAAIMTCTDAEENCPFIPGAEFRITTTYDDPKVSDHSPLQNFTYDECCRQIAREIFYVFSKLTSSINE